MPKVVINIDDETGAVQISGDEPFCKLFLSLWTQDKLSHYIPFMGAEEHQKLLNFAYELSKENRDAWIQAEMSGDYDHDVESVDVL